MSNPEYIFKGMSDRVGPCVDLDQVNLDRSESFRVGKNSQESFSRDEPTEPTVRELNCFGIDPNEF